MSTPTEQLGRRGFLAGVAASAALACSRSKSEPVTTTSGTTKKSVATRRLGRTNVMVSMVGIGGAHLGKAKTVEEAVRIVHTAIDNGVTFMDNCWDYNGGKSEEWMGKGLADGWRQRAFLMTKLDGRTKDSANAQLEQSLRRLGTDVIDLVQVHEVIRDTDPARVFGAGGAIEALIDAKKKGKIRFIGFTGHKDPDIHLAMLKTAFDHGFTFDTVQMPINVMDAHYKSFQKSVLPVLIQHDIGVLGMKCMGSSDILASGAVTPVECLRWALSQPTSVVITGCESLGILQQAIDVAAGFTPLTDAEKAAILARTEPFAREGKFEQFKTSTKYDGTAKNPHWLDGAEI
jgi:aryl-alcohol dehydrogenase-like predicted oxidoreductase